MYPIAKRYFQALIIEHKNARASVKLGGIAMGSEATNRPKAARGMRTLDDQITDGLELNDIKCRSCSGYGNCGYKQYFMDPSGKGVVSVCMMTRKKLQCERDGVDFSLEMLDNPE